MDERDFAANFFPLARWFAEKGYSLHECFRLALECLTPEPENVQ